MKIYTKKGDGGQTSLIGGTRVPKDSLRIEAYGTIDELNSFVGFLRDQEAATPFQPTLAEIQDRLFTLGSLLAEDPAGSRMQLPGISEEDVELLEKEMDRQDSALPEMRSFVLPGGHPAVSSAHICRTVCRRAERITVHLSRVEKVDPLIITYLNRLSDYFFVLSRTLTARTGATETPWVPRMEK